MRLRVATVLFLALIVCSTGVAADPVRTTVAFNAEGDPNVFPFGIGPTEEFEYLGTYQQLYSSAAFTGRFAIEQVAFKTLIDERPQPWNSSFSLRLGTTGSSPLSPLSYEANRRSDLIELFSGTISVAATGSGEFDFVVPLAAPFLYNSAAGNLLLDVFIDGNAPGRNFFSAGSSSSIGRVFNNGGTGFPFTSGGYGLATSFLGVLDAEPVPEPATVTLIGSGLLGLSARVRRRRRKRQE